LYYILTGPSEKWPQGKKHGYRSDDFSSEWFLHILNTALVFGIIG